jgi:hypothetical protein
VRVTAGTKAGSTVTVVVADALPYDPVHKIAYDVEVAGLTTLVPDVEVAVVQVAEHAETSCEVHVSVEFCPL